MKVKNYDYGEIGKRLRTARKECRFTQEELAERVGVGSQHISDIERGLTGMSVGTFIDICSELNADANYILFGISSPKSESPVSKLLRGLSQTQITNAEKILEYYSRGCREHLN